jgi:hypothetical protein
MPPSTSRRRAETAQIDEFDYYRPGAAYCHAHDDIWRPSGAQVRGLERRAPDTLRRLAAACWTYR